MRTAAEAATKMLEGFIARDLETAIEPLADDVVVSYSDAVPWSGDHVGQAGFQVFVGTMLERFDVEVLSYEIDHISETKAVSRIMTKFVVRDTGESTEMPVVEMYWAENGKLVRIEPYYRNQTLVARMHASAAPATVG